jgi:hypothetical protein
MDDLSEEKQGPETAEDLRQIGKWTRVYAQNRSLGVVVFLIIFVVLSPSIGGGSYLGGYAVREGNVGLFWACMAWLGASVVVVIYFSVPWWGGKAMERIAQRLYAKDGAVALDAPRTVQRTYLMIPLGIGFFACIVVSVALGLAGLIPIEYMQPVSASYCVPFMVGLVLLQRPAVSYLALLWPFLYGLHAVLILAGVPIRCTGAWQALDIILPMAGYGILSAIVAHLYGRFALSRLKKLAQTDGPISGPTGEVTRP